MKCPFCGNPETKVVNSRTASGGESVRRRRACEQCKGRFTTFESVEKLELTVIKRSGERVPYCRDNLREGIEKACKSRPVTQQQIDAIVDCIERECFRGSAGPGVETSDVIGRFVLQELKPLDEVAYLRFASVYKKFNDVGDFHTEIESLKNP